MATHAVAMLRGAPGVVFSTLQRPWSNWLCRNAAARFLTRTALSDRQPDWSGRICPGLQGQGYLIDFGIARRFLRPQQRKDRAPLGSPGYAAPEQYGREQTTPQTDIYSLGATLQTLLTGKEPLDLLLSGGQADHTIPKELQALITRMLEREPGEERSHDQVECGRSTRYSIEASERLHPLCAHTGNTLLLPL